MIEGGALPAYAGVSCAEIAARAGATRIVAVERCASTMDVVHQLAADGAAHGTVAVAEEQEAGRGRSGKAWRSTRGAGVWASALLRRPADAPTGLLSVRVGIALAEALDAYTVVPVQVKWPNDLFLHGRKVAGVLAEARWRGEQLDWIVVGVGVNVLEAETDPPSSALGAHVSRAAVLIDVVQAILGAARGAGRLTDDEMSRFHRRDVAAGRDVTSPLEGTVLGIDDRGGLRVRTTTGEAVAVSGSLILRHPLAE